MHYPTLILGACLALSIVSGVRAQESKPCACPTPVPSALKVLAPGVTVEPSFRVHSKNFEWEHEIQVALPPSYATEHRAYPVLWVTDGLLSFETAIQAANSPFKKVLPEMIVIAVGAPSDVSAETHQARRAYEFTANDKGIGFEGIGGKLARQTIESSGGARAWANFGTGGAPKFLAFLVDELRGTLEKKYRMSGGHTLVGSSTGGFFCIYALLARPKSFDKYICLSPALNMNDLELFRMEETYAAANKDLPAALYLAAGEGEILQGGVISGLGIVSSTSRMAEILNLRAYPSLKLYVEIVPGGEHGNFKLLGLAHGLRAVWGNSDPSR